MDNRVVSLCPSAWPSLPELWAPLRALWRLGKLGAITASHMAQTLVVRPWLAEDARRTGARACQRWCTSLVGALGLEMAVRGEVPVQPSLLVANHVSYVDIAAIGACLPCVFLAKQELRSWPILGAAAQLGGTIFVHRTRFRSRAQARSAIGETIRAGTSVVVFPHGTTNDRGGAGPFQPGAFQLAARCQFPVVPVALRYEDRADAWVGDATFVGHFLRRFGNSRMRVQVRFGPTLQETNASGLRQQAETWVARALDD